MMKTRMHSFFTVGFACLAIALTACSPTHVPSEPPKPEGVEVALQAGTPIVVSTAEDVSTVTLEKGQTFAVTLAQPLEEDGETVAPRGAPLSGKVVAMDPAVPSQEEAELGLQLTKLTVAGGETYNIQTETYKVQDAAGGDDPDADPLIIQADRELTFRLAEPVTVVAGVVGDI